MGYARYTITRNGEEIEAGYTVAATCEQGGCTTEIDRGIGYLCGAVPGGDEYGCGGYFCGQHLYAGIGPAEGLCGPCGDRHRGSATACDDAPHLFMTAIRQQATHAHDLTKAGQFAEAAEQADAIEHLLAAYRNAVGVVTRG